MKFAEIIRSSSAVRALFDSLPVHRWWWRGILALHGKPCRDDLTVAERKRILSQGFRFYGLLYAGLAAVMAVAAVGIFASGLDGGVFWGGMSAFGALYLAGSSGLAFEGARRYATDTMAAGALLVVFFVAVIGFLMFLLGALAVFVNQHHPKAGLLSVSLLALFALFGVGSYLIELLYLFHATRHEG